MSLKIYNTLSREKEEFKPITPGHVGMYVCGPTVYSDVHLGNCRTFISFDIIYRYLLYLGYKVRYVRNITDAGHLEGDRDEGDDKFSKIARLQQLEPMEIVQKYTLWYCELWFKKGWAEYLLFFYILILFLLAAWVWLFFLLGVDVLVAFDLSMSLPLDNSLQHRLLLKKREKEAFGDLIRHRLFRNRVKQCLALYLHLLNVL